MTYFFMYLRESGCFDGPVTAVADF